MGKETIQNIIDFFENQLDINEDCKIIKYWLMSKRLENKNIVVTAAGQGIGRATAIAFHNEGAKRYSNRHQRQNFRNFE